MKIKKFIASYEVAPFPEETADPTLLRVFVMAEDGQASGSFVFSVERLELVEIELVGGAGKIHVETWVKDDFFSALFEEIECDRLDQVAECISRRIHDHFGC